MCRTGCSLWDRKTAFWLPTLNTPQKSEPMKQSREAQADVGCGGSAGYYLRDAP